MLRAVTITLALMWAGLLFAPEGLRDVVGLAGIGALVAVLLRDRWRAWRAGRGYRGRGRQAAGRAGRAGD